MDYIPTYIDQYDVDMIPSYTDSLTHHGIKGQKWGIRRFQNEDGTRTAAGLRRELTDRVMNHPLGHKAYKNFNNDKVKKGLKIAGSLAAAGALAYGIHKSGAGRKAFDAIKFAMPYDTAANLEKARVAMTRATKPFYTPKAEIAKKTYANNLLAAQNKNNKALGIIEQNLYYPRSAMTGKPSQATLDILQSLKDQRVDRLMYG